MKEIIDRLEHELLKELKEDYCTLSLISACVNDALGFPELLNEQTAEQKQIEFQTTLDFIEHLLKNRNCKVFYLKCRKEKDRMVIEDYIESKLSPEENIEKIKKIWLENRDYFKFEVQPWFTIDEK